MSNDIAVIGMAGRFPMAQNLDELFVNLKGGKDCVHEITEERLKQTALPPTGNYIKCGYLSDIDKFDNAFFGISNAEAVAMSPDQRLLLEIVHGTFEQAGYAPSSLSGTNTSVFISKTDSKYYEHASEFETTLVTGNSQEFLAAKIGRHFNLQGNVAVIDTTCSSSLVALHTAVNEMILGDADMALVGGVNLQLFPFIRSKGLDTFSPDGISRAFSKQANGMSYGEAVAAVLLKPMDQAVADGDNIQAIIKATAVNYNGDQSSSITAPDSQSQARVFEKAWKKAGISPVDLSFIEAHGSGTQLGDSLEFEALNLAFGKFTDQKHLCPISTIKSNTGHGRNVAGLAGLVKAILALKHRTLFPNIHFEEPSELLDYEGSAVFVNTELKPWEVAISEKRLAGVTSLGASGTNTHVVLQEAPERKVADRPIEDQIIRLSAKSEGALRRNIQSLLQFLKNDEISVPNLADIAYTLDNGRDHYPYRCACWVKSIDELISFLERELNNEHHPAISDGLIFISTDSSENLDRQIAHMKATCPGFSEGWTETERLGEINNDSLKDFAYQYVLHQVLKKECVICDQFLPLGIGAILSEVLDEDISLQEGFNQARNYHPERIENIDERFKKLTSRLAELGQVTLIELSVKGTLHESFCTFNDARKALFYTGNWYEDEAPLSFLQQLLYPRGIHAVSLRNTGQRIELPTYQFDKHRFWLRDTPKETKEDQQLETANFQVTETCDGLERGIAEIFGEILEVSSLSINDNFFDLGGDSLNATRVIKAVNHAFHLVLDFEDIFDFPTVKGLATIVRQELDTEKKIILIWEKTLRTQDLKATDDFFELGGHSLLATELIVHLNKEFQINLNFEDLFRNPTIRELQEFVDDRLTQPSVTQANFDISPVASKEFYPLSHAQKRMWFLHQFVGGSSTYNNILGIEFRGALDLESFNKSISSLVERHESLRSTFHMMDDEPRQKIHSVSSLSIQAIVSDLEKLPRSTVEAIIKEEQVFIFDLSRGPLFRIRLIRTAPDNHVCILNIHHVISDGWSIGVLIDDFSRYYNHHQSGKAINLEPLAIQIKDFAEWQHSPVFQELLAVQKKYWLEKFGDDFPALELPLSRPRKAVQSFDGNVLRLEIDQEQTEALQELGKVEGTTLFMVLLALYNILLSKLSNAEDVLVGSPVAGRRFQGTEPLIGLFMNTIVLRNRPSGDLSFLEFLARVKQTSLEAFNHQDFPYEELVNQLNVERTTGRNPLFDTMFILHNNRKTAVNFDGVQTESYGIPSTSARFDLLVECAEDEGGLRVKFEYATELFDQSRIEGFMESFKRIMDQVLKNPSIRLRDISLLNSQESEKIIVDFNDTSKDFDVASRTLVSAFEACAQANSLAPALTFEGTTLSYKELDETSNALAHTLIEKGVGLEDRIGVLVPRSPEMIISLLAVLKAGGAYIPLDPNYPEERVLDIIEDSGLKMLLTSSNITASLSAHINVKTIDVTQPTGWSSNNKPPIVRLNPHNLAYLIYTSGSTGRPKGVMIEHRSVINFIYGVRDKIRFEPDDSILCLTTVSFDIFVLESFLPLLTGMRVVLANEEDQQDPGKLLRLIDQEDVRMLQITPSHLNMLLASTSNKEIMPSVETLMVGGEAFPLELLSQLKERFTGRIYNMYGPTETTIWSTIRELTNVDKVDIGAPIANTTIRIVDQDMNLQPIGIVGELCIGGAGLARGYWQREALTNQKFIADPYITGGKLYRTGDLARWNESGTIEYLGRKDDQVKIRGFRIEPGEVESQLSRLEDIDQAVVVVREVSGEKQLVGYYKSGKPLDSVELRMALSDHLPEYMIPSYLVHLDEFPLTPNGKVNKRELPVPEIVQEETFNSPATDTEKQLAAIWSEILHLDEKIIGQDSDFFQLGGHSIRAVFMTTRVQEVFAALLPLRKVFENASLRKLSAQIDSYVGSTQYSTIGAAKPELSYTASPAQERIFFRQSVAPETLVFNISSALRIPDSIGFGQVQEAFQLLMDRHESLRTNMELTEEGVMQFVHDHIPFELPRIDGDKYEDLKAAFLDFVRPFDLTKDVLIRVGFLDHASWGKVLLIDLHHIIADGVSLQILIDDFKDIFLQRALEPVDLHYKDFAVWQQDSPIQLVNKTYWTHQLDGLIPRLDLPTLSSRRNQHFEKAALQILRIEEEQFANLKSATKKHQVSDYMYLLSVFYVLLNKMSGNHDMIIGTDVIGRNHPQLQKMVGTFVNVLPLRMTLIEGESFEAWLSRVKSGVLDAFDHQDFQFDQMIALVGDNDPGHGNPIFDVHFSFANATEGELVLDQLGFEFLEPGGKMTTQYELKLEVFQETAAYAISFVYSEEMYDAEVIELFVNYYRNILQQVLSNPQLPIGEIEMDEPMDVSL